MPYHVHVYTPINIRSLSKQPTISYGARTGRFWMAKANWRTRRDKHILGNFQTFVITYSIGVTDPETCLYKRRLKALNALVVSGEQTKQEAIIKRLC